MNYMPTDYMKQYKILSEQLKQLEIEYKNLMEMDLTFQTPEQIENINNPKKGGRSGVFGRKDEVPYLLQRPTESNNTDSSVGPNSDWANTQRASMRADWARGEMEKMGVPTKRERFDAVGSADDLLSKAGGLLDAMDKKEKAAKSSSAPKQNTSPTPPIEAPAKPTGNSTQQSLATAVNSVVSGSSDENPLGPRRVQPTADPKVSTYEPGGFAEKPTSTEGIGKIQLVPSPGASPEQAEQQMGDWGKRRLEAEVGFPTMSNARKRELEADFRRRNFSSSNPNVRITPTDVSYKAPTTSFDAMTKYRQEEQEMINRVNQQRGTNISGMQYSAAPAVAGVDVEGPSSDLKDLPAQTGNNSIVSQLMKAFGDAGNALFDLPRQVSNVGEKIQKRR